MTISTPIEIDIGGLIRSLFMVNSRAFPGKREAVGDVDVEARLESFLYIVTGFGYPAPSARTMLVEGGLTAQHVMDPATFNLDFPMKLPATRYQDLNIL